MTDMMDEPSPATAPEIIPRRPRLTMGTMMAFVLTAAASSALFAELSRLIKVPTTTHLSVDIPTIVLLGISLNAVALGCWRRHRPEEVLAQVTLCCLLILGGCWLWEWKFLRGLRYWLQVSFAAMVVVPLVLRSLIVDDKEPTGWERLALTSVNTLIFSYLNFIAIIIVAIFQTILMALLSSF